MSILEIQAARRRTIRAPVNPYDKATVVSILNRGFTETKPTIQPGTFSMTAGTYEKPAILVVGPSSWWREIDEEQPLLEIPVSAIQIADSIVRDYCNGLICCNMVDCMPGMFYLPGEIALPEIREKHQHRLDEAKRNQENWFRALVDDADKEWAKTNGNPVVIHSDMRMAATALGVAHGKEWMKDFQTMQMIRCVACGAFRNPDFPVCGNCKAIIDIDRAKELKLSFAT